MDAVDYPGHVLFVIDVRGLWEKGLEEKPVSYCHWEPLSSTKYGGGGAEARVFLSNLRCALPCYLGYLGQSPPTISSQPSTKERHCGCILSQGSVTDT